MLKNHCALVTGATQGIGRAIVDRLASAGADVILHGIEPSEMGEAIAQKVSQTADVKTAYVAADLADASAAAKLVDRAAVLLGPPDILINNAGIQFTCPIESFPADRWDAIIAINLSAAFHTMKSAVPAMRRKGWGRIVNIASVHGLVASVDKCAYLAAKHGLVGMSKGVALETAAQGITVNCICPGWTDTAIIQPQIDARAKQFDGDRDAAIRDLLKEKQPNLKLLSPTRIGDIAVFLCSDAAEGITGIALAADGGWTAQ